MERTSDEKLKDIEKVAERIRQELIIDPMDSHESCKMIMDFLDNLANGKDIKDLPGYALLSA